MSWPVCQTCCMAPCVCRGHAPFQQAFPGMVTWYPYAPSRVSDEDVERIAKRVVELMAEAKKPGLAERRAAHGFSEPSADERAKNLADAIDDLDARPSPLREKFTVAGHHFTITPTGNATSALHTGMPLFRVYCSTCGEEVTDSTTGPHDIAAFHTRDRSP